MTRVTRRRFFRDGTRAAAAGAFLLGGAPGPDAVPRTDGPPGPLADASPSTLALSLDGEWLFRLDPDGRGERDGWAAAASPGSGWSPVLVPHTWQVDPASADFQGAGWYRREVDVPEDWAGRTIRAEFEAVYHTATVWVNGTEAGVHPGRGYTAFALDVTRLVRCGARNTIAVKAVNSFSPDMLPRGSSYDWAMDGGITRPARLLADPPVSISSLRIDAAPNLSDGSASIAVGLEVRNDTAARVPLSASVEVVDDATGLVVLRSSPSRIEAAPGATVETALAPETLAAAKLWHFDHPNLYRLRARISGPGGAPLHEREETFGVRSFEVRDGAFVLNGERVRLMGVERMAGSHPLFGMAEPESRLRHDHEDLKALNCVYTRVHWPQDRRVLDWCDRHGILVQTEVPSWGPDTFRGMTDRPAPAILENGLAQLREMVRRDRNHPCVASWGLCNEVDGGNPPAREFVRTMLREAKRLDPGRPCTYASNSLQSAPGRDVAGEMDFVMWNEYYESWYGGTTADLRRNLEAIRAAFPGKPVVVSEYGWCACTPERPEGDERRIEILRSHDAAFRDFPWVAGLIFFDYNDYRTHIGDKGRGALKQRVHGVVDLFGARKPSFEALRRESSPVEALEIAAGAGRRLTARVRTRSTIPAYILRGYRVRWTAYGAANIPVEMGEAALPDLRPGEEASVPLPVEDSGAARRLRVEVVRPTGFSAATAEVELGA